MPKRKRAVQTNGLTARYFIILFAYGTVRLAGCIAE